MRLKSLKLESYRGHPNTRLAFSDFACLVGQNGVGKTTVLNAIALLCSSLDFKQIEFEGGPNEMDMKVTAEQRLRQALAGHIRTGAKDFMADAVFEHEGKDYSVVLTKDGFAKNEILKSRFWWPGIYFMGRFDSDMVNFQLPHAQWAKFAQSYTAITGFLVEPDIYEDMDMKDMGLDGKVVCGFWLHKKMGKIYSKEASAGEKKLAKALTQVLNLEEKRQPHIVLVDNIEMHIHHTRHLQAVDEFKKLFAGKQLITTSHSLPIISHYEPKADILDLDEIIERSTS